LENFSILRVKEITPLQAVKVLSYRSLEWERKSKVKISYKAIKRAVELATRFYSNVPLPSSAQNILTEALEGARRKKCKSFIRTRCFKFSQCQNWCSLGGDRTKRKRKNCLIWKILFIAILINQEEAVELVASALRQYRDS